MKAPTAAAPAKPSSPVVSGFAAIGGTAFWARLFIPALAAMLCCSCSSVVDSSTQKAPYMQAYLAGAFDHAAAMAEEKAKSRAGTGDALMWELEAGKSAFAKGDYQSSLAHFNAAEKLVADFEGRADISARDISSEAASALTNPNAISYRGSYVDREMLNAYKALIYFALGKPEDACVEIKRMHLRQKKAVEGHEAEMKAAIDAASQNKFDPASMLGSSPEVARTNAELVKHSYKSYGNRMNPFCSYLSSIGYLWRGDYNEAMVDFRNLRAMDPANPLFKQAYVSIGRKTGEAIPQELGSVQPAAFPLDRNVVYLIVENGLVPSRRATTVHLLLPPPVGYTGVAFPTLVFMPPALGHVDWSDNFGSRGSSFRISDMDAVASYEFKDSMTAMIVRIVISTLVKEGAAVTAYELTRHAQHDRNDYSWAADLVLLGASLWKYTFNTADTRSWQTLPKEFQGACFPMPQDGVVRLGVDGGPVKHVLLANPKKKMTILYVQSPGNGVFSVKVFQFD